MESVDLKQKNFPFRKKFEEFYPEDEASLVLKKAFCMFFGAALGAKRDRTMACVQNRYQLKFFRLKKKWAEQF